MNIRTLEEGLWISARSTASAIPLPQPLAEGRKRLAGGRMGHLGLIPTPGRAEMAFQRETGKRSAYRGTERAAYDS